MYGRIILLHKMAGIVSLLLCWIGTFASSILAETRIAVTSPVNPVKFEGILSLHCQVWGIEPGQEVTIFYQNGDDRRRLSLNDNVVDADEDQRMFLATRQLDDGSLVYFLSIIMTEISDSGKYSCKIMDPMADVPTLVATDSVHINVQFFPEENFPMCNPDKQIRIQAGTLVNLNCSSELGYPPVLLTWTQEGNTLPSSRHINEKRVDSILTFKPRLSDNGAILLCTAQSAAFPDKQISCHVGPLMVYGDDGAYPINTPFPVITHVNQNNGANTDKDVQFPARTPSLHDISSASVKCAETCNSLDTGVLHWIISTSVACAMALLFLLIGIVLLVKYNKMTDDISRESYLARQPVSEDIYEKMEYIVNDRKMYMTLAKQDREHSQQPGLGTIVYGTPQRDKNSQTIVGP